MSSELYEKWFNAIFAVHKVDQKGIKIYLDPEKVRPVTLTVPAWVNARMDIKCDSCGWPIYPLIVGSNHYLYCTNPECIHCSSYNSISSHLQGQDRIIRERRERFQKRRAEREAKAEEERKEELRIENAVRHMFYSFGIRVRKTSRRAKT